MLCKEHGITVLAVCMVYDAVLCWKAVLLLCFRFRVMGGQLPQFLHQDNPSSFSDSFLTRCLSYSYIWYYNGRLLMAPLTLSYDWQVTSLDPDPILCGLLMMVVPFLPASNIMFRVGFVIAERVLYIPSCGYCILIAWGAYVLYQRLPTAPFLRDAWTGLFIIVIITMAAKTWKQNQVWRSRESLFRSGIRAIPHNAKVHYNYANHLKDSGQHHQAVHHYKEAIRLYPTYASAHNNMGTILKNVTEAEYHYREALKLVPTHKGALINLGSSLFKRGEVKEGHDIIQKLLELDPTNTEGIIALAGMQVEMKEWENADHNYKQTQYELVEMIVQVGINVLHFSTLGDLEGAVDYYKRAFLKESRDQWTPMVNAAQTLNQLGRTSEAENILKGALNMRRDVTALDILGLIYYRQGRLAETVKTYREIQTLDPRHAPAMLHFSQVLAGIGEPEKAETLLRDLIQYNPSNLDILTQMTNVLGQQGKHKQALSYLEEAIRLARQGDPETLHNLLFQQGNHYKDLKMYQHALKSYNETVQIQPNNAKAHLNIGAIFHLEGYLAKARYHYTKVLHLEPDNSIAKDNLRKVQNLEKSSGKKQRSNTQN
ncbi:hypothetical protein FSP39_000001 [Pinctada imbricata]|uniref:dolichyl-phosphate-mannose--protein mannosyltransferase n=1 Tax=Pinctada imbricata TaxID=66713 RepID=A0AA88YBY5_PINIB|nr:hypothetical protein FSP39_000001 [Pinctada imbricata]